MPNHSGKGVDYLREIYRTTSGRLSPIANNLYRSIPKGRVQLSFTHKLSDLFTPNLSPYKMRPLPLTEHTFYPVSTAPINNPTKIN